MARGNLSNVEADVIDQVIEDEATGIVEEDEVKPYELIGAGSVPVSIKTGARWKQKIDDALATVVNEHRRWHRIFQAYNSTSDSQSSEEDIGTDLLTFHGNDVDENLIRENVKLLLRSTYTRNPKITLSSVDPDQREIAKTYELALQSLLNRKAYPGLNAKARIRRQIVHAHLTNFGILKLDYQEKVGSRQEALQNLERVQEEMSKEENANKLEDLYAELEAIEEALPTMHNSGMTLANTLPIRVIVDPVCTQLDLTDADWLAEEFLLSNEFIRNKYLEKNDDGEWVKKSNNKPTKVVEQENMHDADKVKDRIADQITGFTSKERLDYLEKGMTRCYLVWDRLTRKILLFSENDWSYPLWVFDDYLNLSRFYQHFIVGYTEPIDGIVQPGEPSQYIGQIREINRINRKISYLRRVAFGAVIYNSKVVKGDTADKLIRHLKNPNEVDAFGLDFDPEMKIDDILQSFVPPVAKYRELFDTSQLLRTVNRASATNEAMRGEQFRTNTTNDAVQTYKQAANIVTNELTDVVEDAVEELAWAMCEILVSKYSREDVAELIGQKNAETFEQMQVPEFNARFSLVVAAGSTEKPSSETKKREALEIAQAIGQMGQSAPMTSMKIISRMFSSAFSEYLVNDEDWKEFEQEMQQTMARGQSAPVPGQPQ